MRCLHCQSKSYVSDSYQREDGVVTRYRSCTSGHRVVTVEVPRGRVERWVEMERRLGELCRAEAEVRAAVEACEPYLDDEGL